MTAFFTAAAALSCALVSNAVQAAPKLAGQAADVSAITVSGLSSGGSMAVQFHVALSASVKGAGILAGAPFYCAEGSRWTANYNCMNPGTFTPLTPVSKLQKATDALGSKIDPVKNLSGAKVWLFSGTHDQTVVPEVMSALERYYKHYVNPANVVLIGNQPAGHTIPSPDPDITHACDVTGTPFISRCEDKSTGVRYDAAGALLAHLLGLPLGAAGKETGTLATFDQREFANGSAYAISLADTGYVYIPDVCRKERCRVHVAFHGCAQHADAVNTAFVRDAGYNPWADAYRLIVLYPQTITRYGPALDFSSYVFNPYGCWDWWGYTGANYHTKAAPQIEAVNRMVQRLGAAR